MVQSETGAGVKLKSIVTFLLVVWAVAASFLLFNLLAEGTLATLLTLNPEGSLGHLTPCDSPESSNGRRFLAPEPTLYSWLLGLNFGYQSQTSQFGVMDSAGTPEWTAVRKKLLDDSTSKVQELAKRLQVPAPALFVPAQLAYAASELSKLVENDATQTARQLAIKHSPHACRLFKMGAYWAFTEAARVATNKPLSYFGPEITHYASELGLPKDLWEPMTKEVSSSPSEQARDETQRLTENLTKSLAAGLK